MQFSVSNYRCLRNVTKVPVRTQLCQFRTNLSDRQSCCHEPPVSTTFTEAISDEQTRTPDVGLKYIAHNVDLFLVALTCIQVINIFFSIDPIHVQYEWGKVAGGIFVNDLLKPVSSLRGTGFFIPGS